MLANLIDRVWTPTLLLSLSAYTVHSLRHLAPQPIFAQAVLAALAIYYASLFVSAVQNERKIDALGLRAPSRRTYTPFNIGMLFEAIWYVVHHRNYEWWLSIFAKSGNKSLPYTIESVTVGQRIIFTADEENMKAVLATQFADYGKGPQFRKEWKDFLGLSECSRNDWHGVVCLQG